MLYLIECGKYTKVGFTKSLHSLRRRVQNMQTGNPLSMSIYCVFPGYGRELEQKVLAEYRDFRCNGGSEWINVDVRIVARRISFMTQGD